MLGEKLTPTPADCGKLAARAPLVALRAVAR
jgi:hypothetical protein